MELNISDLKLFDILVYNRERFNRKDRAYICYISKLGNPIIVSFWSNFFNKVATAQIRNDEYFKKFYIKVKFNDLSKEQKEDLLNCLKYIDNFDKLNFLLKDEKW